jgi:hypothetical protein
MSATQGHDGCVYTHVLQSRAGVTVFTITGIVNTAIVACDEV